MTGSLRTEVDRSLVNILLPIMAKANFLNVDNKYKLRLLRCLLASILRPIPSCPPVLPFGLRLFTSGLNDPCRKISKLCGLGLAVCQTQIHPFVPSILIPPQTVPSLMTNHDISLKDTKPAEGESENPKEGVQQREEIIFVDDSGDENRGDKQRNGDQAEEKNEEAEEKEVKEKVGEEEVVEEKADENREEMEEEPLKMKERGGKEKQEDETEGEKEGGQNGPEILEQVGLQAAEKTQQSQEVEDHKQRKHRINDHQNGPQLQANKEESNESGARKRRKQRQQPIKVKRSRPNPINFIQAFQNWKKINKLQKQTNSEKENRSKDKEEKKENNETKEIVTNTTTKTTNQTIFGTSFSADEVLDVDIPIVDVQPDHLADDDDLNDLERMFFK